ncbi:MAG: NAD(P)/FAD-dependent oxidoreductase, partial [Pseudohongiellaceae bacterium]
VVVIGSGATAVTLVPAMTDIAAKVTMIQRSPSYIVSRPGRDQFANALRRFLPEKLAYRIVRFRNIHLQNYFYRRMRKDPQQARSKIMHLLRKDLDPRFDIDTHFTPRYDPWDQRLCLVPDADLFRAMNAGTADIVTGEIDRIDENGVLMKSGEHIQADIIVMATGLQLQLLGGIPFTLDGEPIDFHQRYYYQGMMFSGVPNLIQTFGYINASWTLRADLNSKFVCKLVKRMDALLATRCEPTLRPEDQHMAGKNWISDFTPGYMQRGMQLFPLQGDHAPWHNTQNYLLDRKLLQRGIPNDGALRFT